MSYKLTFANSVFGDCLIKLPKTVQKKVTAALSTLRQSPTETSGSVKKLKGTKDLWRYRLGDYRLVYRVQGTTVTLLFAGHRKNVYDLLRYDPDQEKPKSEISVLRPDMLDKIPPAEEIIGALEKESIEGKSCGTQQLPEPLSSGMLEKLDIPRPYWPRLQACSTDDDLLNANLPEPVLARLIEAIYPRAVEHRLNEPRRVVESECELEEVIEGKRDWREFILDLDDDQRSFVEGYGQGEKSGPWIVKGGPGSGKSTIALYCIRELLKARRAELGIEGLPRILYTTFTNSLKRGSEAILRDLLGKRNSCEIHTINSLATKIFTDGHEGQLDFLDEKSNRQLIEESIKAVGDQEEDRRFSMRDKDFIQEEIEWVILGNNITKLDYYRSFSRTGRSRQLGAKQREQIWKIWEHYKELIRQKYCWTLDQVVCQAYWRVTKDDTTRAFKYDYVFIDEAQDLKPVAIRLAIALCREPRNVFITADPNQTIYGKGISWAGIDSALRRGRAKHKRLTRNYRSTQEIVKAVNEIAEKLTDPDVETLGTDSPYEGDPPVLRMVENQKQELSAIEDFIRRGMRDLGIGPGGAAILVRANQSAEDLAKQLSPALNAKYMPSKKTVLDHPGVKVMTMHAAKGLEFPTVVVAGVNSGELPFNWDGPERADKIEEDRKLFFVACSRAMRRLMVTANKDCPSVFVTDLSDDNWLRE
jgi:superfamily I DNA/RNA helicase/mRNA-degrading endonuclease RelE of RelBE toxin-antitoxin system